MLKLEPVISLDDLWAIDPCNFLKWIFHLQDMYLPISEINTILFGVITGTCNVTPQMDAWVTGKQFILSSANTPQHFCWEIQQSQGITFSKEHFLVGRIYTQWGIWVSHLYGHWTFFYYFNHLWCVRLGTNHSNYSRCYLGCTHTHTHLCILCAYSHICMNIYLYLYDRISDLQRWHAHK